MLNKVTDNHKPIFLAGDFNFNLLKYGVHHDTTNFLDILHSHYFLPLITAPTRISSHSATLIDNIFINNNDFDFHAGNISTSISDHLPQYVFISDFFQTNTATKKNMLKRSFRSFSLDNFKKDLADNVQWNTVYNVNTNVNINVNYFVSEFNKILDRHAPPKKIGKGKLNLLSIPWVTKGIYIYINKTKGQTS